MPDLLLLSYPSVWYLRAERYVTRHPQASPAFPETLLRPPHLFRKNRTYTEMDSVSAVHGRYLTDFPQTVLPDGWKVRSGKCLLHGYKLSHSLPYRNNALYRIMAVPLRAGGLPVHPFSHHFSADSASVLIP